MATPVAEYESSWSSTTSPKTSSSLSVQAGDVLAVVASGSLNLTCSDSQGLSWTLRQSIVVTNYEPLWLWTATVAATGSLTVTVTRSSGSSNYGMNVTVWRGVTVGASSKTNATGAPSLGITTTAANSAIVVASSDWAGVTSSRTWRTGAGAATELWDVTSGSTRFYGAYHADAGTQAAKTVGLSAPSGQTYSIIALELVTATPVTGSDSGTLTAVETAVIVAVDAYASKAGADSGTLTSAEAVTIRKAASRADLSRPWTNPPRTSWASVARTEAWHRAVTAQQRTLMGWAELVDVNGKPVQIDVGGRLRWRLPLSGMKVGCDGERQESWQAVMAFTTPWLVPRTSRHPLWGASGLLVRGWWSVWSVEVGEWLSHPVCTVAIGDTSATDDGLISGTVQGRDVLSTLVGYSRGAPDVSGMTVDAAIALILARSAPALQYSIAPSTVLVPEGTVLKDPRADLEDLSRIGWDNGVVRSDRLGIVHGGPRPEPADPPLDWTEGPGCPVSKVDWTHGVTAMGNEATAVSTHTDAAGLAVTVSDDDPTSPTYVGGPMGRRPLPVVYSSLATTAEALRSEALAALDVGLHPTEDAKLTARSRPDLDYMRAVLLGRDRLGLSGVGRVSSWSLTLPTVDALEPMSVGLIQRRDS